MFCMCLIRGCPPLKPRLTFCLETKSKQKIQDCARFARKTYAQLAKTVQTRSFVARTGQFFKPTSLVFRLIGRGRSSLRWLFNSLAFFLCTKFVLYNYKCELNVEIMFQYKVKP